LLILGMCTIRRIGKSETQVKQAEVKEETTTQQRGLDAEVVDAERETVQKEGEIRERIIRDVQRIQQSPTANTPASPELADAFYNSLCSSRLYADSERCTTQSERPTQSQRALPEGSDP
jgi:hypothetical protein